MKHRIKNSFEAVLKKAGRASGKATALELIRAWGVAHAIDQRRKVTDQMRVTILAQAAAGVSVSNIVAMVGVSAPTVRKVLNKPPKRGIIPKQTVNLILREATAVESSVAEIARIAKVSKATVRRVLRSHNR